MGLFCSLQVMREISVSHSVESDNSHAQCQISVCKLYSYAKRSWPKSSKNIASSVFYPSRPLVWLQSRRRRWCARCPSLVFVFNLCSVAMGNLGYHAANKCCTFVPFFASSMAPCTLTFIVFRSLLVVPNYVIGWSLRSFLWSLRKEKKEKKETKQKKKKKKKKMKNK